MLSDHFSQIEALNRKQIDLKIQNWCYSHDNVNDSFNDSYTKLEASVSRQRN